MRALIIDEAAKARAAEIVAYAEAHHYEPGRGDPIPGDDPHFVAEFMDGYRVVFSFTKDRNGNMWRHISISVPNGYPNPPSAFMICELFGLTGWDIKDSYRPPSDWLLTLNDPGSGQLCVVIAQPTTLKVATVH